MKYPFIVVAPWLKVDGMALFPFILVKHQSFKTDSTLIRHEAIHLRQEIELLILPFYILYLISYLVNLAKYKDHHQAYLNIVFEKEAYAREAQTDYLQKRAFWAWLKFITFKK